MIFHKLFRAPLLIFSLVLISCSAHASDVITIGVATPQSGDFAMLGKSVLDGVSVVVDDLNAHGGLLGKQIKIVVGDDNCNPDLAVNIAKKLINDKVDAVIGHLCSGATKSALPFYTEEKIITISPSAANVDLTKSGSFPYFFRTIPPSNLQSKLCADFALNILNAQKVAIIHDKSDYGNTYAGFVNRLVQTDEYASVVLFQGFSKNNVNYNDIVQKIIKSKADTVFFGGYHPEGAKLILKLKENNIKVNFISSVSLYTENIFQLLGNNTDNVYLAGTKNCSPFPLNKKATEELKKRYNKEPLGFYFEAYSAMLVLANAIETAQSTETDKVLNALKTQKTETPLGTIRFDKYGDLKDGGFQMYKIKNGKFIAID
ncbi:branched-chain amino acid ABC transporter substrate-binding protein [Desulfovibrio litoralis]|uniref:Branched-chain amino acid transport system substrate-binding protein n=1 Tax=Desulfovibrio litoralis DSM 11393 TaxID=1121455 RepID=A0A1M7SLS5_9BACT|nr:branched-chain amino acid ABC transporter substrate-binding protein [Desulfovibrio litoralis]SHN59429.1 branched-chain amino acid transport system substrate-binding protein [Desulfovibrio litoralis DSM 11393]